MLAPESPRLGVFFDEPAEVYYQRVPFEASNSVLKIIDEDCPFVYRHWLDHPEDDETTEAMVFGNVVHCVALEPDEFSVRYAIRPANAPKRPDSRQLNAKKPGAETIKAISFWNDWDARNAGKIEITAKDYDTAQAMVESLRRYPMEFPGGITITGGELLDACRKEVVVRWIDEETGLLCKLRADLYSEELAFAGDLKSCAHAGKSAFSRMINQRRYHVAHAHYSDGFRCAGAPIRSFTFLAIEKRRPHACASWHIDAPSEERGWAIRQRSMRKLAACRDSGQFPSYTTTVSPIGIPAYGHYDADKDQA